MAARCHPRRPGDGRSLRPEPQRQHVPNNGQWHGVEPAAQFETVANHEITSHKLSMAVEHLRDDIGLNNQTIREAIDGQPRTTREEYEAVKRLHDERLHSKEWVSKLLSGDKTAQRELILAQVVLRNGYRKRPPEMAFGDGAFSSASTAIGDIGSAVSDIFAGQAWGGPSRPLRWLQHWAAAGHRSPFQMSRIGIKPPPALALGANAGSGPNRACEGVAPHGGCWTAWQL